MRSKKKKYCNWEPERQKMLPCVQLPFLIHYVVLVSVAICYSLARDCKKDYALKHTMKSFFVRARRRRNRRILRR
jgi:hypothetical protein